MNIPPIIQSSELLRLRPSQKLVILDVGNGAAARERYLESHLEGALYVDLNKDLSDIKSDVSMGGRHPLPSLEKFSETLGALGISPQSHVVAYDDKNGSNAAARLWWMLRALGHERVQVLNGGLQAAVKAGFSTESGDLASPVRQLPIIQANRLIAMKEGTAMTMHHKDLIVPTAPRNHYSRRQFLQMSSAALGGLLLAGCAAPAAQTGGSAGGGAAAEAVTLTVLNANWGELYNGLMEKIGEDYIAANPGVTIEWTFEQEWKTKLLTQVAGGTPPDAAYTNWTAQANLAEKNTFTPLDSYMEATGLKRDDFVISMYDASVWDGKLYAIPGGADYITLFWNKDVYRDVGIDPEAPPKSGDEWIEHSKAILQKDGDGNITRIGYVPNADQFITWAYLNGGEFYDADNRKVTANDPVNVQTLEWLLDYVKLLDINKLTAFNANYPGYSQAGNPFSTKQSAYLVTGFWAYDALNQFAPDIDYGITFQPTPTGAEAERANYLIQGWMYTIPTGAKQADTAWDFIKYAFIDEAAKMGYLTLNGPCVKSSFKAFEDGLRAEIGAEDRSSPYLDVFTKTGEAGTKHWPNMSVNGFYYDEIVRIWDFVARGEKTPQEALDEVTTTVQAELDKAA